MKHLRKQCNDLLVKLNESEFKAATYKRGLATLEDQIITYKKNEVLFSEEVAVLKREKQSTNVVCEKESKNYKENSDESLAEEEITHDKSSFVESLPNVDKENLFPANKNVEFTKPKNHEKPVKKSVRNMSPKVVLLKTGHTSLNIINQVNTAHPKTAVHSAKSKTHFSKQAQSTAKRPFYKQTALTRRSVHEAKRHYYTERHYAVNTARSYSGQVNAVRVKGVNAVKSSAYWVWRPTKSNAVLMSYCMEELAYGVEDYWEANTKLLISPKVLNPITSLCLFLQWIGLVQPLTKDETSEILKNFIKEVENLVDKKVKIIRSDNGTEFKNKVMDDFCKEKGKFDGKSDEGFFIGYSLSSKAFRVYNTRTRRVKENLHIGFLENKPMIEGTGPKWLFDIDSLTQSMNYVPVTTCTVSIDSAGTSEENRQDCIVMLIWKDTSYFDSPTKDVDNGEPKTADDAQKQVEDGLNNENAEQEMFAQDDISTKRIHKDHPIDNVIGEVQSTVQTRRMSKPTSEQGFLSDVYEQKTHDTLNTCLYACFLSQIEPTSIAKALSDSSWVEAMQEELLQFKLQQVWILVDLPNGKKAIRTKWVFKNKKDERGIMIRNTAKLVAQGHRQEEGINYEEVFAPMARIKAIRLFLAYASFMGFLVYQMDVKSAFLYGTIEEEVYVTQPPGFKDPDHPDKVYKVVKALYGLHQAPRAWYETLANYLLSNGFKRGKIDQTLFIKKQKGDILLVQVYVDDIIFGSTNKELCTCFEKLLKDKFQMSSMGELTFFLGLQVQQKEDGIFISQDKYVAEILKKFNYSDVKSASTHVHLEKPLVKDGDAYDVDVHLYRSMIGSLMYLTASRPDIMFACKKQTVVATSTTEAEYVAATSCCGQLQALVDKKRVIVMESSIRRDLHLDDAEGTDCLPTTTILEELARMGSMASLIIYLATNQKFNLSKYIFDAMVKHLDGGVKFLLYPRFLHVFINQQLGNMSSQKKIFVNPFHKKKIFANMKRAGKDFSGRITPLFDTMMVKPVEEIGKDLDHPTDYTPIPIIDQPSSSSQPKKKQPSKKAQRQEAEVPQDAGEHEESVPTPSNDPQPSGEDSMQLTDFMVLCTKLQTQVLDLHTAKDAQAKEIVALKKRIQRLERRKMSRPTCLKRLRKIGMTRRVKSSEDQESLGAPEDTSKQGRSIEDIDADIDVSLVDETQERQDDDLIFDTGVLEDDEMHVEAKVDKKEEQSTKPDDSTAGISNPLMTGSLPKTTKPTNRSRIGINKWYQSFALRNFDLEDMEFESTNSNTTAKLPILKLGEYEMWVIRIKQYFQIQDYAPPPLSSFQKQRLCTLGEVLENGDHGVFSQKQHREPVSTLMLNQRLLPLKHRFGGNAATKKTQKTLLKQEYENFSASSAESLDSIFNRL
ncbi:putative ribonuclease H-like domain-containing protein [Tanacetum coccineum]